jgi:hypothetical protein
MQRDLFRNRKLYVLAGLLILLVIINVTQWGSASRGSGQSKKISRPANTATAADPILLTDRLHEGNLEFTGEKRNIFSFGEAVSSEPQSFATMQEEEPPPPPDAVCGNNLCESGEDLTNCPEDCQPPPPPAPVISLRYIGYMAEQSGSVAFLTDGKEVYMGRVNDVIANQYRVLKITEDSVELGFINNNQSSTIRFQGNPGV